MGFCVKNMCVCQRFDAYSSLEKKKKHEKIRHTQPRKLNGITIHAISERCDVRAMRSNRMMGEQKFNSCVFCQLRCLHLTTVGDTRYHPP